MDPRDDVGPHSRENLRLDVTSDFHHGALKITLSNNVHCLSRLQLLSIGQDVNVQEPERRSDRLLATQPLQYEFDPFEFTQAGFSWHVLVSALSIAFNPLFWK